jgi:hypothetical protein
MHNFLTRNYAHIKYTAEHSILPVHLLTVGHYYSIAMLIAMLSVLAYAAASTIHRREEVRNEG